MTVTYEPIAPDETGLVGERWLAAGNLGGSRQVSTLQHRA